jgi:hypothetical protein
MAVELSVGIGLDCQGLDDVAESEPLVSRHRCLVVGWRGVCVRNVKREEGGGGEWKWECEGERVRGR